MSLARVSRLVPILLVAASPGPAPGQAPPASKVVLEVGGTVPRPLRLSGAEFSRLPRQAVLARERDGQKEARFEGVPLVEVLRAAGVRFGHDLRGPAMADYLVVEAADGYRVVFALPELDPASTDRVILLADRRDGAPLGDREGPLRVIVPGEKRPARWVRQVVALRIGHAEPPAGAGR